VWFHSFLLYTHLSEHECHLGLVHQRRTPRPPLRQSCFTTDTVNMPSQHILTLVVYLGTPPDAYTAMSSALTPNSSATLPLQSCSTHHHYDTAVHTPDTHTCSCCSGTQVMKISKPLHFHLESSIHKGSVLKRGVSLTLS